MSFDLHFPCFEKASHSAPTAKISKKKQAVLADDHGAAGSLLIQITLAMQDNPLETASSCVKWETIWKLLDSKHHKVFFFYFKHWILFSPPTHWILVHKITLFSSKILLLSAVIVSLLNILDDWFAAGRPHMDYRRHQCLPTKAPCISDFEGTQMF